MVTRHRASRVRVTAALLLAGGLLSLALHAPRASAQVTVWVDFTSDTHNGLTGGPNGKADWIDELGKLAVDAGVDPFTIAERATIETGIVSKLTTIYSGYSISFTTAAPPGPTPFDAVAYGLNSFRFRSTGTAPTDVANIASGQVAGIATGNFDDIVDEFDGSGPRSTPDRTAHHRPGRHRGPRAESHVWDVTPLRVQPPVDHAGATYASTGGVQNTYMAATGTRG